MAIKFAELILYFGKFLIHTSEEKTGDNQLGKSASVLKFRSVPDRRVVYQMPAFINASIPRQTAIVAIFHSARLNMICGTHRLSRAGGDKVVWRAGD